jgi:hypothetical protein
MSTPLNDSFNYVFVWEHGKISKNKFTIQNWVRKWDIFQHIKHKKRIQIYFNFIMKVSFCTPLSLSYILYIEIYVTKKISIL